MLFCVCINIFVCICLCCLSGENDVLALCIGKCLAQALTVTSRALLCQMLLTGIYIFSPVSIIFSSVTVYVEEQTLSNPHLDRAISILQFVFSALDACR